MSFDTIKEEKRIFERLCWCLKKLFNIDTIGIHLSKIDKLSPFDYHSSLLYNGAKRIGLIEIRYTAEELNEENESYVSLYKKQKAIDTNRSNGHRIFVVEHPDGLYIADLMRAKWTNIRPSKLSKKAYYFNKWKTPHLIILLKRNDSMNEKTEYELRECLVKDYKNIQEAKSILMHMTDSIL